MALKRDYQTGTKFLYVTVQSIAWNKNGHGSIQVETTEKDTEDADYESHVTSQTYTLTPGTVTLAYLNQEGVNPVVGKLHIHKNNVDCSAIC